MRSATQIAYYPSWMAGIIAANAKQGHNLIGSVKIVDMIHVLVAN